MANVELRDPIHGFISLTETECKIADSNVFQRLRRISQLALASLVYPGALHTRFEHSLGVMWLAKRLADRLLPGESHEEERRLVRLAALLHDLGHGPFSHVSESVLGRYAKLPAIGGHEETIHEAVTCSLIRHSPDLKPLISKVERGAIIDILAQGKRHLLR